MAWGSTWKRKLYVPGQKEAFALSRSKIELFMQCPKCFYLDRVHGIARPQFPAFLLNSAVDELFKKEFDMYRSKGEPHPIMQEYGINAVPYQHPELDKWRHNFTGVRTIHAATNFELFGAVDDIWITPEQELYVVDYKSTSKDEAITLEDGWKEGYKRQLEIYQWLLRQKGFKVSDKGFFVYANGRKDRDAFDATLDFDVTLLEYVGSTDWVEGTLLKIKKILDSESIPEAHRDCEHCEYVQKRKKFESDDMMNLTIEM